MHGSLPHYIIVRIAKPQPLPVCWPIINAVTDAACTKIKIIERRRGFMRGFSLISAPASAPKNQDYAAAENLAANTSTTTINSLLNDDAETHTWNWSSSLCLMKSAPKFIETPSAEWCSATNSAANLTIAQQSTAKSRTLHTTVHPRDTLHPTV